MRFRAAVVCACHAWSAPHHPVQTLASPRRRGTISEARFAPLQVQRPHRRRRTNSLNIQARTTAFITWGTFLWRTLVPLLTLTTALMLLYIEAGAWLVEMLCGHRLHSGAGGDDAR